MKKSQSNTCVSRILEIFAKEKSVYAVMDKIPGMQEKDVWKAVAEAAVFFKGHADDTSKEPIFTLCVDGSAIPNPGDAGIGIVIKNPEGKVLKKISRYIGHATNNYAEYTALVEGLLEIKKHADSINVYSDSELMIKQMKGLYRVKDAKLLEKYIEVKNIEKSFKQIHYKHVLRDYNSEADELANSAARNK
jgi:ribonuclease HI